MAVKNKKAKCSKFKSLILSRNVNQTGTLHKTGRKGNPVQRDEERKQEGPVQFNLWSMYSCGAN